MGNTTSRYTYQESDWPYVWALWDSGILDWKQGLDEKEVLSRQRAQNDLPVQISPHLFLGNCQCVADVDKLRRLGIKRVLNMAGSVASAYTNQQALREIGIVQKVIAAEDEETYPLLERHWQEAQDFIHANGTEKILVHCVAGHNRSALIVAADYLLSTPGTNVLDTVRHIRFQRGNVALQNEGFQEQLVAFARVNNLLGEAPVAMTPAPKRTRKSKINPLDKLT